MLTHLAEWRVLYGEYTRQTEEQSSVSSGWSWVHRSRPGKNPTRVSSVTSDIAFSKPVICIYVLGTATAIVFLEPLTVFLVLLAVASVLKALNNIHSRATRPMIGRFLMLLFMSSFCLSASVSLAVSVYERALSMHSYYPICLIHRAYERLAEKEELAKWITVHDRVSTSTFLRVYYLFITMTVFGKCTVACYHVSTCTVD